MKKLMKSLSEHITNRKMTKKILELEMSKLDKHLQHLDNLEEARVIFQKASQMTQVQLSSQIEKIVSNALEAVGFPYKFVVNFVSRRNSTETDLWFSRNGKLLSPLNSCGFGASDIASLALRVAYWKLDNDSNNILILDEPTKYLSLEKHELASMMISQLSKMEGGLQFIIVTHSKSLAKYADKQFIVTKTDDISTVTEIIS